ncbi:MAG: NAD-dependent epimerase/dehydratase family protein [Hyphomicrobiaceae bacterium]
MDILIVGGTGSGGQSLIRHLRSRGPKARLTVVSRTATALSGVERVLRGHYADLIASSEVRRQLAGFDAVVHLADGLSVLQHSPHAADEALAGRLIGASEGLAAAVRDARVPLLVHVSSIKALCDEADDRVLVETSPSRATTLYGRSKWQLEQRLAAALTRSDTRLAMVRNPVMYGGAKPGSMSRLLRLADSPLPLPLAGLANKRSLLALGNFASALAAIVEAGLEPGADAASGAFHVHDGPALSTTEIVETLRAGLGRRRGLFPIGALATGLAGRTPAIGPAVRRLYGSLELSDARFLKCFRWTPVIDSRDALSRMARSATGGG